jgi:hypothetical protein
VVAIASDSAGARRVPGRARVYLGLETAADSERLVRHWRGARATLAVLRARGEDPDELEPIDGFRRSIADDGTRLHLGLRVPAAVGLDAPALLGAMRQLAAAYGTPQAEPPARETAAALSLALGTLDKSGDWRGLVAAPIPGESGLRWSGFRGGHHPPAITFGDQAPRDLLREIAAAGRSSPASPPSPASPCATTTSPAVPRAPRLGGLRRNGRGGRIAAVGRHAPRRPPPPAPPRCRPAPHAARCGRTRAPAARRPARIDGQDSPDSQAAHRQQRSCGERQGGPNTRPRTNSLGAWLPTGEARRAPRRRRGGRSSARLDPRQIDEHVAASVPRDDPAAPARTAPASACRRAGWRRRRDRGDRYAAISQTIRATRNGP